MKILKFDTLYPAFNLEKKISEHNKDIEKMNFEAFSEWLIQLRMNFSDFYSYNLSLLGWEAKEFFVMSNRYYIRKLGKHYFGNYFFLLMLVYKIKNQLSNKKHSLLEKLIEKIIDVEKPNVLFIREQSGINSMFWDKYRDKMLVVSRMECGVPKYWSPACFDLVYTNINTYRSFFESNRIPTKTNYSGFDERLIKEVVKSEKIYDVVFIGGLGSPTFTEKTEFLENLLEKHHSDFNFKWWGYKENSDFDIRYPFLSKFYSGITGGLDMFQIYSQSKIVLNDYGLLAGGQGMNQRIYEVLGIGSFLLTRESSMFDTWKDSITTFSSVEDCATKIIYYLENEDIRELKAKKGQEYVLKNHNYKDIMRKLSDELKVAYDEKFGVKHN